jgi:hypothetical protein
MSTALRQRGYSVVALHPAPEYGEGQYTVNVTLNTTSATLLFDSGYNGTLTIHPEQADAAGLHRSSAGTVEGFAGRSSTDTARLKTFGIDALHFGPQPVSIGRFPMADGAIGAYFISTHGTILDYSHDLLYLQVKGGRAPLTDVLRRPGDVVIPLKRVKGKGARAGYYLRAMVNGVRRLFLLDTGWGGAALNLDQARASAFGLDVTAHATFGLGTIVLETDFTLVDLSAVRAKQARVGMPQLDGVIGCEFLKDHGAIIDFTNGMMYLRP